MSRARKHRDNGAAERAGGWLSEESLALGAVVGLEILNPPLLAVAFGAPLLAVVLGPHLPAPVARLLRAVAEASPLQRLASG